MTNPRRIITQFCSSPRRHGGFQRVLAHCFGFLTHITVHFLPRTKQPTDKVERLATKKVFPPGVCKEQNGAKSTVK